MTQLGQKHGATGVHVNTPIDLLSFSRLLAKIAHGYTVETLGVDGFEHQLTDFILGRMHTPNYFVGANLGFEFPPSENLFQLDCHANYDGMVFVKIRLFAYLEAPTYLVFSGILPGGSMKPLNEWRGLIYR